MLAKMFKIKRSLKSDQDGISAVEFALIAPLMAIIYFGCIELSFMMTLDRKVTSATAALGDLTARASTITDGDLTDIFHASRMVLQPNDMSNASLRVTSLEDDGSDTDSSDGVDAVVQWSDGCGVLQAHADDITITIPANLIPSGGTLIMAEIQYPFNSPIGYFFSTEKTLSDTFYLRPRRVDSITRDDDASTSVQCWNPYTP